MKTIFRNLAFGVVMAGSAAISASATFAQDAADVCKDVEPKQVLYKQFTDNIPKNATIDQTKTAIKAGDEYLQKYGACAEDKAIVDYLNQYLPGMKTSVKKQDQEIGEKAVIDRFNTSAKAKNTAEIIASGKELVAKKPELLDVNITMAAAAFEQTLATPPVNTYNDEAITQAKTVIQQLESGKTCKGCGAFTYSFANEKYPDTKNNTLGAMNYMIGYIMYYRQNNKQGALPYMYKSTQYNSFSKTDPTVYQAIGAWYLDEAIKIDKERQAKLTANGNKDNDETLAMVASQKGYADRAIDAYSRAYKYAKDDKLQKKEYVDGLYNRLKEIYAFRFDGKTEGIDAFVATVQGKPMPDPTTPITPVKEETPAPTAATNAGTSSITPDTSAPTTKPAANTTNSPTKPTTAPVKKPTSSTTNTSSGSKVSETTVKAGTKKTTPKKKGTR